jgi:hypothetical protein
MEFVSAVSSRHYQASLLENIDVLRNRLTGRCHSMPRCQAGADLKQRLSVPRRQLVEDDPSGGVRQGFKDVTHRCPKL